MNEWCKCNFCKTYKYGSYYSGSGCDWCSNYSSYTPDSNALIKAAKDKGISVTDVIKLIEYCGG